MDRFKKKVNNTLAAASRFMNPDRLSYIQLSWQTGELKLGSDRPNSQWVELAYQTFYNTSANGAQTMELEIKTQDQLKKVLGYLTALENGGHTALETERGYVRENVITWSTTLKTRAQNQKDVEEYNQYLYQKLSGSK